MKREIVNHINNGTVQRTKNTAYTSFTLMDGFRKWAKRIGMAPETAEKHIRASSGRGFDALYAGLKLVQDAYERKDREYA